MDDKKGIDLVFDRIEALRVRLDAVAERQPLMGEFYDHWNTLLCEALGEVYRFQSAWDLITASMALPESTDPQTVAVAVRQSTRRLEQLEQQMLALRETKL